MEAKIQPWWEKVKKPLTIVGAIVVCMLGVALIIVIALAYIFKVNVSGLRGKNLWDWLQLLIVPLALAIIALLFQRATTRTEQKIAAERYKQDQEIASRHYHQDREIATQRYQQDRLIALDKQREDLLQTYLDRMSELLLEKGLRTSTPDSEVRNVARVRTITILFQLDARRIGYVFAFLRESRLMSNKPNGNIVSLSQARLRNINFSDAYLYGTNFIGVDLSEANLSQAIFYESDLSNAKLSKANLSRALLFKTKFSRADLIEADLSESNLDGTDFSEAFVHKANLSGSSLNSANFGKANLKKANLSRTYLGFAKFVGADLSETDLSGAHLYNTDLSGADLSEANLTNADLIGANLSNAIVTIEQLEKAKSLKDTTMPDGSKHE